MTPPLQWQPPAQFAAGDTLHFQLNLPLWQPNAGWYVTLSVTEPTPTGGTQVVAVRSVPDATNTYHTFDVQNFLATQQPGDLILAMQITCSPTGVEPNETHQIFVGPLKLLPNFASGAIVGNIQSEAQKKLFLLNETYDDLAARRLKETDVQRTRLLTQEIDKILEQIKYWKEQRTLEVGRENAKNGKPPGNQIRPLFAIGF
jgi:hypothetical protein